MDTNLFWVLIGTGLISVLTLIYVVIDESLKRSRYENDLAEQGETTAPVGSEPSIGSETSVALVSNTPADPAKSVPPAEPPPTPTSDQQDETNGSESDPASAAVAMTLPESPESAESPATEGSSPAETTTPASADPGSVPAESVPPSETSAPSLGAEG